MARTISQMPTTSGVPIMKTMSISITGFFQKAAPIFGAVKAGQINFMPPVCIWLAHVCELIKLSAESI